MKQFSIELFNGHPIIRDGEKRILIDTGAPSTIHTADSIDFVSESFGCTTTYMGLTVSRISELLGTEITTLLGVDILSGFKILIDYQSKLMVFSKEDLDLEGTQVDVSKFMGIPIIEMTVNNQVLKFFLDTGAKLSYLTENLTRNFISVGVEDDFYPGVGNFQTDCFEIPTVFGNHEFVVKYGNLPHLLQSTLMLGGTQGIIGFDFFNNFKVVLDLSRNKLQYVKLIQSIMMNEQNEYDLFPQNTPIYQLDSLCGPSPSEFQGSEWYFLNKFIGKSILDIGCGTGHRTFPDYDALQIKYFGIEKSKRLIEHSNFNNKIIEGDICSENFSDCLNNDNLIKAIGNAFDLAVLFGGVVNGFIAKDRRGVAWNNISNLLKNNCQYVLFDTLTHFDWYPVAPYGQIVRIFPSAPPQYFYSYPELLAIFDRHGIELVEKQSERIPNNWERTLFLIKGIF